MVFEVTTKRTMLSNVYDAGKEASMHKAPNSHELCSELAKPGNKHSYTAVGWVAA